MVFCGDFTMFRIVKRRMFTSANYFKVINSVIINIMIFMMYYFVKFEFSSNMFFHNISMFSNVLRFYTSSFFYRNPYKFISKIIDLLTTFPISIKSTLSRALQRTKSYFMSSATIKSFAGFFTIFAGWSFYEFRHIYTIDGEGIYGK